MKKLNVSLLVATVLIIAGVAFAYQSKNSADTVFNKKQECSKYIDLANQKIEGSGRVFEKDTYSINELFYSPKMNTCLYAYTINTTFEPKEIYSIDDIFGGGVFTGSIEADFYAKLAELKI